MRLRSALPAAGLCLISMAGLAFGGPQLTGLAPDGGTVPPAVKSAEPAEEGCHGTAVTFVANPSEAAKRAKKAEKLVMVLHVSGNFEDPAFT
jgi:hypothetical protein